MFLFFTFFSTIFNHRIQFCVLKNAFSLHIKLWRGFFVIVKTKVKIIFSTKKMWRENWTIKIVSFETLKK